MSATENITDYQPRCTGAELMEEARRNCVKGKKIPWDEYIVALPDCLADALDIGVNAIDYRRLKETDIAIAMRCFAVIAVSLEEQIIRLVEENGKENQTPER